MLNRHTKQVSRDRCHGHGTIKSPRRANVSVAFRPFDDNPEDLEPGIDFLRSLIEVRVLRRLDEIFEEVRRLEGLKIEPACSRAIRLPEVLSLLGISKSTLYGRLNPKSKTYDAEMPRPFKLGNSERSPSVWWDSAIADYLTSRAQLHHAIGG